LLVFSGFTWYQSGIVEGTASEFWFSGRLFQICNKERFRSAKRKVQICKRRVYYSTESVRQHQGLDKDTFKKAMTLRMGDILQGAQNFATWKERVTMILDVNDVLEHIAETTAAPTDVALLGPWKKGEAKAKIIILDGVKDHIIPHLTGKTSTKDMWAALSGLY
jgi:hypothetical protein